MHPIKPINLLASRHCAMFAGACVLAIAAQAAHAQLGSTVQMSNATSATSTASGDPAADTVIHQAGNDALQWQESTDTHRIRVRQYVTAEGKVYAVSWDGPAMPDVAALLGTWFGAYQTSAVAAQAGAQSLHSLHVERSDLVVETAVRLRDFTGRAWLPAAIPPGVTTDDIQ